MSALRSERRSPFEIPAVILEQNLGPTSRAFPVRKEYLQPMQRDRSALMLAQASFQGLVNFAMARLAAVRNLSRRGEIVAEGGKGFSQLVNDLHHLFRRPSRLNISAVSAFIYHRLQIFPL